jgi:hypothetical protein
MCGKQVMDQAVVCPGCGCQPRSPQGRFCWCCGAETNPGAVACLKCGAGLNMGSSFTVNVPGFGPGAKSRSTAGLLNLLCFVGVPGGIGRLYLGYTGIGVAQLLLSFLCIGHIWSIIDGILMLTGSVTTDAEGHPLTS